MNFQMIGLTDPGRVRANNEDAIGMAPELGIAVLADGMGGHNAGEVASAMAVEHTTRHLSDWLQSPHPHPPTLAAAMQTCITLANQAILEASRTHLEYRSMGTTLVLAVMQKDRAMIGHIGDSRAYRWRHRQLTPLTRDHSVLQEHLDAGLLLATQARHSSYRHLVTRAMGLETHVQIDLSEHALEAGDVLLLCSDGLTDMLSDEEITTLLSAAPNLEAAAQSLRDAANVAGGRDNISLILTQCSPEPSPIHF